MPGGTFTVTGMSASEPAGNRQFGPYSIQGTLVVGETLAIPLASGDNTITVPASGQAVAVWIVPPTSWTTSPGPTLLLRTNLNASDTGLPWNSLLPFGPYPLASGVTALIVNANGAQASPLTFVFI